MGAAADKRMPASCTGRVVNGPKDGQTGITPMSLVLTAPGPLKMELNGAYRNPLGERDFPRLLTLSYPGQIFVILARHLIRQHGNFAMITKMVARKS